MRGVEFFSITPDSATDAPSSEIVGMTRLMQAVIVQALQDLKTMSAKPEVETARAEAIAFFERRGKFGPMFDEIAELAGWCPEDLQERYRAFISSSLVDFKAMHREKRLKPWAKRRNKIPPPHVTAWAAQATL